MTPVAANTPAKVAGTPTFTKPLSGPTSTGTMRVGVGRATAGAGREGEDPRAGRRAPALRVPEPADDEPDDDRDDDRDDDGDEFGRRRGPPRPPEEGVAIWGCSFTGAANLSGMTRLAWANGPRRG